MNYRCVQCGFRMKSLFVQYSPGNIRLMKCENCKAVADEYIECELMILVIDLILHKPKAYRHLLYNVLDLKTPNYQGLLWKCTMGFLLLDAYRSLLICRRNEELGVSSTIGSLIRTCQKVLIDVILGNSVFVCAFLVAARTFINTSMKPLRCNEISLAILVSSYFKLCLFAMMVWEYPSSLIFVIDLYVLSSNIVALNVITHSAMGRCVMACLTAHAMKFVVIQKPDLGTL